MNGKAPKSYAIGSQIVLGRKLRPDFCIDKWDCVMSSKRISPTIASTARAHATTTERKAVSAKTLLLVRNAVLSNEEICCGWLSPAPLEVPPAGVSGAELVAIRFWGGAGIRWKLPDHC